MKATRSVPSSILTAMRAGCLVSTPRRIAGAMHPEQNSLRQRMLSPYSPELVVLLGYLMEEENVRLLLDRLPEPRPAK